MYRSTARPSVFSISALYLHHPSRSLLTTHRQADGEIRPFNLTDQLTDQLTNFLSTTMSATIQSRPLVPHIPTSCSQCSVALEFPVPSPAPRPGTLLNVRCYSCQSIITHAFYPGQIPSQYTERVGSTVGAGSGSGASSSQAPRKGRKIGTQEKPLETGYYDLLGVPIDATTDDIKKAYRTSLYQFPSCPLPMAYPSMTAPKHRVRSRPTCDQAPSRQEPR